ncbi:MAG: nitroreductase family deazaflavin-dependent oxidoreductase [Chloroflexi bacterium]|nr:nitroreductase family deazaflavin-dependent oxidoreductase [Chloroflexota bacterium]
MENNLNEWNRKVIDDFRANGGKVNGQLGGVPLLLLTTTGAKSGLRRVLPLGYLTDGERLIVAASKQGAPTHPAWYHNLLAHPEVTVEVGNECFTAIAAVVEGEERERLWARALEQFRFLGEHQSKTTRQIPLVALERSSHP